MDLTKVTLANGYFINKKNPNREKNDYFPTPAIGTLTLLRNHNVPHKIWECAAGKGHISKELIRNGHEVISTDLYEYENSFVDIKTNIDFLTAERQDVDGVVTNPPFTNNLPEKLIKRCLIEHKYSFVAVLCRVTFMESSRRYNLFTEYPVSKILIFSERINCNEKYYTKANGIGGMICYAWFIWDKNYPISNEIRWVKPSNYVNELGEKYENKSDNPDERG